MRERTTSTSMAGMGPPCVVRSERSGQLGIKWVAPPGLRIAAGQGAGSEMETAPSAVICDKVRRSSSQSHARRPAPGDSAFVLAMPRAPVAPGGGALAIQSL
jgi:hypothetical protein